jgi:hypothetical protein
VGWFRCWLPGFIFFAALFPMTVKVKQSANVTSRYMTIEAIVERGTLAIERTPMIHIARPVDMVRFGNHYYSDKPPVLAVLAVPIYAALAFFGARFTGSEIQYALDNLVITWLTVGVASAFTLVCMRRLLQTLPIAPSMADLLTLGLGFGTQILTYAVTFNNHSVAAGLILGAITVTLLESPGNRAGRSRWIAGFLAGLASTIDLPAGGMTLLTLGGIQAVRVRSIPWAFSIGALGPLLLHAWLQSLVTGTPLPAEMYPEAWDYPDSFWMKPENLWHEHGPRWRFGVELLVGPRGWLTVTPVLAFGLIGLAMVLARQGDPFRPMATAIVFSLVVLIVYYTWLVRRTDFGGDSFGTRHLLAISPPCYFFAIVALGRIRRKWVCVLFGLAMAIGIVYAWVGKNHPWKPIENVRATNPYLKAVQRLVIYPRSQNLEKREVPR